MLALFVKRPVLAAALSVFILFTGVIAYLLLPVRDYPVMPASRVTVTTTLPGASPQVMEGFVSTPLEEALTGLDGVDYISSSNSEGQSVITLKFPIGYDIDAVLPQVSNRVNSVVWKLPKQINGPTVKKINPNSGPTGAIMYISYFSDALNMKQLSDYMLRVVQTQLESVKGVATVEMWGDRMYSMRIWLNPRLMAAHHVSASEVVQALRANNLRSTAGQLKGRQLLFNVSTSSTLSTPKEFNQIVVKSDKGRHVRIADIGVAKLGAVSRELVGTFEGRQAMNIGIVPQANANSIEVAKRVKTTLKKLQLPPKTTYRILLDKTQFSIESIKEVHRTLIEACICVFIVIFLFLGSMRLLAIPIVTIPLSLLGGCGLMLLFGYSLNSLTFLAAVLAIGLVVDDAIVVIENVHRHIQMGQSRLAAAINGVTEIRNPVISMTLTVAIVLLPIGFVSGFSGALFKEFAFCMAMVVIISGILALFVSPAMCGKVLEDHEPKLSIMIDKVMERFKSAYKAVLHHFIRMKWLVLVLFIAVIAAGLHLSSKLPSELIPPENEGVVIAMGIAPTGMNQDYTMKYGQVFNKIFAKTPGMLTYGVFYGFPSLPTQVIGFVVVDPFNKEGLSIDQIIKQTNNEVKRIPGLLSFAVKMPTLPGAQTMQSISFVLKTTRPYAELSQAMNRLLDATKSSDSVTNAQSNLKMNQVQVDVTVNRNKADAVGVTTQQISDTLAVMLGKPYINRFGLGGRSYEVIPQVFHRFRMNPDELYNIYIPTNNGKLIPLSDVVNISESMTPNTLNQFQLMRSATLTASVAPGYTLGQSLKYLKDYVHTHLGGDYHVDYSSQSRQFIQSEGVLQKVFVIALFLIYLLLTINFASFRDPLIVMLSVPLSLVGAVYAMFLSGATFNIYTKIGLIMLVGLISKHGILIVNFANMLQEEKGLSLVEAAVEAAAIRLRPILMTTAAMIAGAVPLVLASGAGHVAREQIGWVIIGGMALGTCLTLFVVPTAYSLFAKRVNATPAQGT
jgi:multidrug efflux pump